MKQDEIKIALTETGEFRYEVMVKTPDGEELRTGVRKTQEKAQQAAKVEIYLTGIQRELAK